MSSQRSPFAVPALVLCLLTSRSSAATDYTWSGATSTDWNTASNWSPTGVPGATDTATFDQTASNTTVSIGSSMSVTIGTVSTTGTYVFSIDGTLTLAQSLVASPETQFVVDPSGELDAMNSVDLGTSTVNNSGRLLLANGASAYNTVIEQQGGTIDVSQANGQVAIGSIVDTGTPGQILLGNSTLKLGGLNGIDAIGDHIAGNSGGLTKIGSGSLSITGAVTYSGPTAVDAGTLILEQTIPGDVIVYAGATLEAQGMSSLYNSGTISLPSGRAGLLSISRDLTYVAPAVTQLTLNYAGGNSDVIFVSGTATLGGSLEVRFDQPPPISGATYTLLQAGSLIGQFGELIMPPGSVAVLSYDLAHGRVNLIVPNLDHIFADGFQ